MTIRGVAVDKPVGKKVVAAHRRVSIPAGRKEKLTVPLDRTGRRLLRRAGQLPVHLTVGASGPSRSWNVVVTPSAHRRGR